MANKILINNDDYGSVYEPSDSEDEYTEHEKNLLKKARRKRGKRDDDQEEEVMRFADSESENDLIHESDIEKDDNDDNDIPDSRAWGKRRAAYYNTDFVDQDYSTYNEKEEELAHQEEEDAKEIQQRLAKELDEADFSLDVFAESAKPELSKESETNKLKVDLSNLTVRQKEQLFEKDSPEFVGLVQDFENYLHESGELLSPIIEFAAEHNLNLPTINFAKLRNNIILTYCTNISFYFLLKSKRISVKNHPIVKRLVQLKQLLEKLNEKYERIVKSQLEKVLEIIQSGSAINTTIQPIKLIRKKLNIMKQFENKRIKENYEEQEDNMDQLVHDQLGAMESEESEEEDADMELEAENSDERRAITYQIAKNKGLTPHRKKELRNPRVKHRNKFRKALIRRKGAVRTVRKELKRYDGEFSGIKATVKKGIKIKS